jgi:hypothetical protein
MSSVIHATVPIIRKQNDATKMTVGLITIYKKQEENADHHRRIISNIIEIAIARIISIGGSGVLKIEYANGRFLINGHNYATLKLTSDQIKKLKEAILEFQKLKLKPDDKNVFVDRFTITIVTG